MSAFGFSLSYIYNIVPHTHTHIYMNIAVYELGEACIKCLYGHMLRPHVQLHYTPKHSSNGFILAACFLITLDDMNSSSFFRIARNVN